MTPGEGPDREIDEAWRAWQTRLDQGEDPAVFIQEFPDELLVALLQTAGEERATTRNLVLAETLRRLAGRPSERSALAAKTLDTMAHRAEVSANVAAQAVHETEAVVDAKASSRAHGAQEEPARVAHEASREVELLRDIAHAVERKADYLMRLHRTGEFVMPGRAGEETRNKGEHA